MNKPFPYKFKSTIDYLKTQSKILFLTTSSRWSGETGEEKAKSTRLAYKIQELVGGDKVKVIDITKLKIYQCEGNVSVNRGNLCGLKNAELKDTDKNPTGYHRCWATINNPDDELWKVSKEIFQSNVVIFFGSIRWGHMNAYYQKLIERLTWIENRHSTLKENNIVGKIQAGIIIINQNWKGKEVLSIQKDVLEFFGFDLNKKLCWNWQFTEDLNDEDDETYKQSNIEFEELFMKYKKV